MFKKHPTKMYIGKTCLMLIQGFKASGHSYFLSISSLDVLNMWLMWRILLGFTAFPLDLWAIYNFDRNYIYKITLSDVYKGTNEQLKIN